MADPRPRTTPAPVSAAAPAGFASYGVPAPLVAALTAEGITSPFPIQSATLPHSLAGKDVLGRGRTGSGKTYAFLLPLVTRLAASGTPRRAGKPRGLILVPTRELATQVEAALVPLAKAMGLRVTTVFGGVPAPRQIAALRQGVDVVVACPGRLTDLVRSGHADLGSVELTVLDEADHMADLGFLPDVRRLLDATPRRSQRLLFSATLDAGVDVLVKRFLNDPVTHSVDSAQSPVTSMEHHVLHVDADGRLRVITDLAAAPGRTVVFTRTKHGAKQLARKLNASGVPAVELHGNLSQNARTRNLASFSSGTATTLVATDIAARGIHVDDVALVIHADPPTEHKAYLHRSGRTARAGASGTVVTMMLDHQRSDVRDLTRKAGIKPVVTKVAHDHPLLVTIAPGERSFQAPVLTTATSSTAGSRGAGSRGAGSGQGGPRRRRSSGQGAGDRSARSGQGNRSSQGGRRSAAPTSGSRPHSAASFSGSRRG
jgi:superfamily II DNA/RNA helicase